jgi:glucokinase
VLERLSIGIDIGGTKVAAGVVDVDGGLRELLHRETPSGSARDVEDTVASLVAELRRRHEVVAVGIGAAGFVDSARATVLFSPHLAWRHEPLRDAVHRRTGMSVVVENDANAAAWAEWRFGAAQNEPIWSA